MDQTTHPDIRLWPHYELVRTTWPCASQVVARMYSRDEAEALARELTEVELDAVPGQQGAYTVRFNRGAKAVATRPLR